jgi:hypothetical protein
VIPRKEIEEVLEEKLAGRVTAREIEDLSRAIQGLEEGWEEVTVSHRDMGYSMSVNCPDMCWLADQVYKGAVIKLYRKVEVPVVQ